MSVFRLGRSRHSKFNQKLQICSILIYDSESGLIQTGAGGLVLHHIHSAVLCV